MKFEGGYLGALVIVLSILLGIGGSLLLNVDESLVTSTKYDYVTDITGLFDSSEEPQYIDFNPATNYTGYSNSIPGSSPYAGIGYTRASVSNNYRIVTQYGDTTAGPSGTVNNSTSAPQAYTSGSVYYNLSGDSEKIHEDGSATSTRAWVRDFKVSYVGDWLRSVFGTLSQYQDITLYLSYPADHAPTQSASFAIGSKDGTPDRGGGKELYYISNGLISMTAKPDRIVVDCVNQTFNMYWGAYTTSGPYSVNSSYIIYGNANQYEQYSVYPNPGVVRDYSTSLSLSFTSTTTTPTLYEYLLPSDGVYIPNGVNSAVWDNDTISTNYDNYSANVLVGLRMINGEYGPVGYDNGYLRISTAPNMIDGNPYNDWILISCYDGFEVIHDWTNRHEAPEHYTNLQFKALSFVFDRDTNNKVHVSIYGVIDFINYLDVVLTPSPIADFSLYYDSDLDNLIFSNPYAGDNIPSLSWSVYNTKIFMDTYNSVMIDPSIDLANYWADMSSYRYAFQSFAIYGDSITINGVTYPVVDQSITLGGKSYQLNNIYISFSAQDTASITFRGVNRTVDLGPIVDKVVSFEGIWYFSAGLYEGKQSTDSVYKWDVGGVDNIDVPTMVLLSLGCVGLVLIGVYLLKYNLKPMDKIVLAFGVAFLFILLGGFA